MAEVDAGAGAAASTGVAQEDDKHEASLGAVQITQTEAVASQQQWAWLTAVFSLMGLALMVASNTVAWSANTIEGQTGSYCPSPGGLTANGFDVLCDPRDGAQMLPIQEDLLTITVLRSCISFTTLASILCLYLYYQAKLTWCISKTQLADNSTILSAPALRWPFLGEVLLLLIHIPPAFEQITASCDGVRGALIYLFLTQWMWTRCFFLIRALKYSSSLLGSNGRFLSALTGTSFGTAFVAKNTLKERPFATVLAVLLVVLMSTAYALSWSETLLCVADRSLGCPVLPFGDALWLLATTFTTIGYGDNVARSTAGRVISLFGGITGLLILAVSVSLINESLHLSRSELKVVAFLRKHEVRRSTKETAALAIQTLYRLHRLKNGGFAHNEQDALRRKLASEMKQASNGGGLRAILRAAFERTTRAFGCASAASVTTLTEEGPRSEHSKDIQGAIATTAARDVLAPGGVHAAATTSLMISRHGTSLSSNAFADDPLPSYLSQSNPVSAVSTLEDATRAVAMNYGGRSPSLTPACPACLALGAHSPFSPGVSAAQPLVPAILSPGAASKALVADPYRLPIHGPGSPLIAVSSGGGALPTAGRGYGLLPATVTSPSHHIQRPPGIINQRSTTSTTFPTPKEGPVMQARIETGTSSSWHCCRPRQANALGEAGKTTTKAPTNAEIRLFERLLFTRVQAFHSLRKRIGRTDFQDPTDRQLTLLEGLECNVGDLRDDVVS
jgi:Ion channel